MVKKRGKIKTYQKGRAERLKFTAGKNIVEKDKNQPADFHLKHLLSSKDHLAFSQAKKYWLFGEWKKLTEQDESTVGEHSDRDRLALLVASAHQQLGSHDEARTWAKLALNWGCSPRAVAQVLISGLHNTLGRIAALRKDSFRIEQHFHAAINLAEADDSELVVHARSIREMAHLGLLPQASDLVGELLNTSEKCTFTQQTAVQNILKSELELLNHELCLAHQRRQLYENVFASGESVPSTEEERKEQLKRKSVSQLGQDLWVLERTGYKREGFFVEFGATDGVLLSNSYLLEKEFGWKGICAEPNPSFYEKLKNNRNCITSSMCIGATTGEEVDFILAEEYGGMQKHASLDSHREKRESYQLAGHTIRLKTISLHDFLSLNQAPVDIDYLSIDTEGSEYEILSSFPFDEWNIKFISVEHNYTEARDLIYKLLTSYRYKRLEAEWDDWYEKIY